MIDPFKTDLEQSSLILKRFALARAFIVTIVAVYCGFLQVSTGARTDLSTAYLFAILAVALIESFLVAGIIAAGYAPTMRMSLFLLCADLVLISAITLMTGGSASVFVFLNVAVILSASLLLSLNWSAFVATICSLLFLAVMVLELHGYVLPASPFQVKAMNMSGLHRWADTGMKIFAFYLTAFLGGLLSHRVGLLQSFHESILNSLSSGYLSINRDQMVTYLNPAGSRLLKWERMDAVGKNVSTIFPVIDVPNPLVEAIAKQKESNSREIAVMRGDGKTIPVGVTVSPIKSSTQKLLGAVGSFIDLTELKQMEDRLRRADRLAAIGETSAGLAHEIRNPVASIRGAVQELSENLKLEDSNRQLFSIVVRECDQLGKIVSDFLEFVSGRIHEDGYFNINTLLDEVVEIAQRNFFNGDGQIYATIPPALGEIKGNRAQMQEALLNVVRNGREAMPAGGCLRIDAAGSGAEVRITIEDEGTGISPEELRRVFDPFFTTKPRGTGLGLAIVHKIITSHKGSIDVDSRVGEGTRIKIILPRIG
ncbi:MAG: PAS domain S-box protein [Candidatus Abyssobacteria bacterium SURF_5]|uniref:histidine kinase n=1 Tax=Abyssobacteria bacterium (strain SURF_5) TaxID=2093360 RepID=A0A3A4NKU9_ABYX5|nr:MAG: PAS domain S-box protein [Candidatus Abyssubacteria bacterium SURF_5]